MTSKSKFIWGAGNLKSSQREQTKSFVSKALDGDWMLPAEPVEERFEDLLLGAFQSAGRSMPARRFGRELEDIASGEAVSKGGAGSGNFGHVGRPGNRGGSGGTSRGPKGTDPTLSQGEKEALEAYKTEDIFDDLNLALREGKPARAELLGASYIEKAIDKTALEAPIDVYRGMDAAIFEGASGEIPSDLTGITFTDKAFVSTSLDLDIAVSFADRVTEDFGDGVVIKATLSKGSRALNMETFDGGAGFEEKELLLQRGTTFKVVRDDRPNLLYVEIVP